MGEGMRKVREKIFTEKQLAQCRTIEKAEEKNATRADGGSKIMFILERTLTFTLKGGNSLWKCCNSEVLLLLTI